MGEHKHYKESGKFSPVGAVLMVLATAVCGGLLFWLYLHFECSDYLSSHKAKCA